MSNAGSRPQGAKLARLLIMGPPGAGKGTQASSVASHFGIPAVSTGDIFRGLQTASTPLAEVDGLGEIGVVSTRIYQALSTSGC
jgi:adenylate kinase family enzyme